MKAITLHAAGAIALTFSIAACSSQQEAPAPTPAPTPSPVAEVEPEPNLTPTPSPTPGRVRNIPAPAYENFLDAPQTPGTWFYQQQSGQTRAVFGTAPDDATFMIFCNASEREITLVRADSSGAERDARIRTETRQQRIAMAPPQPGAGIIAARLSASDPLLDAMAITKGRFAVETAGLPALYLPAWVEVTRVIEDCR